MDDAHQSDPQPSKKRRAAAASYQDLLDDREEWKQLVGKQHADSEERTDRVLAAVTAQTDAQRGLTGQIAELVAALSASRAVATDDDGGNGRGDEATPAVRLDEGAAADVEANLAEAVDQEPVATDLDEAPAAPEETAGDTVGEAAVSDDNPEAGQEPESATTVVPEEAASDQADEAGSQSPSPTEEVTERETEPAEDAAPSTETPLGVDETTHAAPDQPAAGEAEETPGAGDPAPASREDGESDAQAGPSNAILIDILGVLSAIRADLSTQSKLIQLIHRNTPPAAAGQDATATGARSMRQHHELMGQLDRFIIALLNHLGMPVPDDAREMPDRPPPTDLSKQLRAERSGFMRFAWIAAVAGAVALPATLALGIFLQQEYALMPVPDSSFGWKDRIWEYIGPEIAGCLSLEDGGAGECVITVTPPTK